MEPTAAIHTCSQCSHNLQIQLKSTPAPHRILNRCFPCISQIIASKPQLGQDRVDLQRLRDCDGTVIVPDAVDSQVQAGQDRVDLQRLRDRDGSLWSDVVVQHF